MPQILPLATSHKTRTQLRTEAPVPFLTLQNFPPHQAEKEVDEPGRRNGDSDTNHCMSAEERGSGSSGWARTYLPAAVQPRMATWQHPEAEGEVVWRNQTSQLSNCVSMGKPLLSLASVFVIWKMGKTVPYLEGCYDDLNKERSTDGVVPGPGPGAQCALHKCPQQLLSSSFSPWHLAPTSCQSLFWQS